MNSNGKNRDINAEDYIKNGFNGIAVDLRETSLFAFGTIEDAVNIPIDNIQDLFNLPHDKKICVFCQKGEISNEILKLLLDVGYDAYQLAGGYRAYLIANMRYMEEEKN